ncbi:LysR family transcriptional regulator (plasmid) [Phyllobacterium sp. 628]|uniref:LysR family transcriptional regulator n=1 Tax=Phyllobacterium sp. 628 TaxID=2718938 RepID=UPI00166255F2|nr:LysR family transcriptional regulator [Phyllobacterium sp. 628]QND54647.1 LysR family transcriptional regulator [Phyllobacterium sp. 628]
MSEPGTPSLDQLNVFLAVVEAGSFAAAGRRLGRATSAISYAIVNLELQLGMPLFDRERTRKPTLTPAGEAALSDARRVALSVDSLRAKMKGLSDGLEGEIGLAVDVMLPTERLVDVLHAFESKFPTVALRLHVEALGAIVHLVHSGVANIGISGPLLVNVSGIERINVGGVELVPVAAPSHPLAISKANLPGEARNHTQLVLTDRSSLTEGQDFGVIGMKSWRLADLGTKHALLLAGIGWGNMPEPMVSADLAAGRLKRLVIPEWTRGEYGLHAVFRTHTPPGPAGAWLIERFVSQIS